MSAQQPFQFSMRTTLLLGVWFCCVVFLLWSASFCFNIVMILFLSAGFYGLIQSLDARRTRSDRRNFALLAVAMIGAMIAIAAVFSFDRGLLFTPDVERANQALENTLRADPRYMDVHVHRPLSQNEYWISGAVRSDDDREALLRLVKTYQWKMPLQVAYILVIDESEVNVDENLAAEELASREEESLPEMTVED
jgi:hypothetical protein